MSIKVVSIRTSDIAILFNTVWALELPGGALKILKHWLPSALKLNQILHGHVDIKHLCLEAFPHAYEVSLCWESLKYNEKWFPLCVKQMKMFIPAAFIFAYSLFRA